MDSEKQINVPKLQGDQVLINYITGNGSKEDCPI